MTTACHWRATRDQGDATGTNTLYVIATVVYIFWSTYLPNYGHYVDYVGSVSNVFSLGIITLTRFYPPCLTRYEDVNAAEMLNLLSLRFVNSGAFFWYNGNYRLHFEGTSRFSDHMHYLRG